MDPRLGRLIVGLALENALSSGRGAEDLSRLYSYPDEGEIKRLHDVLIASEEHGDRKVAVWLEPALRMEPPRSDPARLVREMREMEFVLLVLTRRAGPAADEVNAWMNYVANAAQFIADGFWLDAKVLLSRALQSSRAPAVEALKADPELLHEVDALQEGTSSYFEELKTYPVPLKVPAERLDAALSLQGAMIEMMREGSWRDDEWRLMSDAVHGISSALRHLLEDRKTVEEAREELRVVLAKVDWLLSTTADEGKRALAEGYRRKIKASANSL